MENKIKCGISHRELVKKTSLSRSYLYEMLRKGSRYYDAKLASAKYWASGRPGIGPVRYCEQIVEEWMQSILEISQSHLNSDDASAMEITSPLPAVATNIVPMVNRVVKKGVRKVRPSFEKTSSNNKMEKAA